MISSFAVPLSTPLLAHIGVVAATFVVAGFAGAHAFALDDLRDSLAAVLPALAGMWLGQRVRGRISAASFRRWFFICLLGLGVELMTRGFV